MKLFSSYDKLSIDTFKMMSGNYAAVLVRNDKTYVVADKIRSYPLFVKRNEDGWLITDNMEELVQTAKPFDISEMGKYELLRAAYTFGTTTLLKDVYQIPAGCYGVLDGDFHVEEYHSFVLNKINAVDEIIKMESSKIVEESFDRMLASIKPNQQLVVPLSGGYDSRLIACLCKFHKCENVVCYTYGRRDSFEVLTSKKVADQLGYKWIFVEYTDDYLMSFQKDKQFLNFVDTVGNLCSLPHYQDYFAISYMHKNHLIEDNAVIIPGYVADIYGGSKYKPERISAVSSPSNDDLYKLISDEFFEWNLSLNDDDKNEKCLSDYLGKFNVSSSEDLLNLSESYWFMKSRACNFILNSVRTYELFGYQWRVPLMDDKYVSFWYTIPWEKKEKSKLYNDFMFENFFKNLHVDFYKAVPSTEKAQKAGAKFKSLVPRSVRSWLRNTYFKLHPSTVNCNSQLTLIKLFESINPSNGIMTLKGALSYAMDVNSIVTRVTINRLNQNIQI